ncbi:NADH:flavin oxidoreductase/NADH oxidase [Micrococcales bacterium 31B]|nr:NADH:flavin oxidoreductase/NADH oxidase [Micrococcales bacterium 31B]
MSLLFSPVKLGNLTVKNRIWLAPMCQYSCFAGDGVPTDWHLQHLGARAAGGFGLVISEAAAVVPEGRISPEDAGLWNDTQATAWKRINDFIHSQNALSGVQLAHAGRKASTRSWIADVPGVATAAEGGWTPVAPSAIPHPDCHPEPHVLSTEEVRDIPRQFAASARLARDAAFDVVEIHAAHGYLLHEFMSPLSNTRDDEYGGSLENRIRLTLEVVDAVREVWGDRPLIVRISATDWVEGGWDLEGSVALSRELKAHGVHLVHVSTGGNVNAEIPVGPLYQVEFAARIRAEAGIATAAVGLITTPAEAEGVLERGEADVVAIARAALREPSWPLRAAFELGDQPEYPRQYERGPWRRPA